MNNISRREQSIIARVLKIHLRNYLDFLFVQTEFGIGFRDDINAAIKRGDHSAAFRYVHGLISVSGTICLLLWPQRNSKNKGVPDGFTKRRGEVLREVLEIPQNINVEDDWDALHKLGYIKERKFRNSFAHIDERFDSWAFSKTTSQNRNSSIKFASDDRIWQPVSLGSGLSLHHDDVALWMMLDSPHIFSICGEQYNLDGVVKALGIIRSHTKTIFDDNMALHKVKMQLAKEIKLN